GSGPTTVRVYAPPCKGSSARETELEAEVRLGPAGQSIACRASAYASMDSLKQQSGRVTQACICVLRLYGLIIRIIKSRVSASARTPSPDSRPSEPAPRPHRRGLGGAGSRGRTALRVHESSRTALPGGGGLQSGRADGCRPGRYGAGAHVLAWPRWRPGKCARPRTSETRGRM